MTKEKLQSYNEHTAKSYIDWNPHNPKQFVSGSNDCRILIFDVDRSNKSVYELTRPNMYFDDRLGVECVKYNPHNDR